jgi:6-phosphogluconolactonase
VGRTFSWFLAGGSTPVPVFRRVVLKFRTGIEWNRVRIFWGDERCVGPEEDESNYRIAKENLLEHLPIPPSNIFRIFGENDPVKEAIRYSEVVELNAGWQSDLIMLGLGADGHTASMFPQSLHLLNSSKLFEATEHPVTGQKRITATGTFINRAKTVIMIATGESKASRAAQVIDRLDGSDHLPAAFIQPYNGKLIWFLDKKASIKIIQNI